MLALATLLLALSISETGSQVRIPPGYNRHVHPPSYRDKADASAVKIGFEILDVSRVDDDKHALTLRLGLSLMWNDTRYGVREDF